MKCPYQTKVIHKPEAIHKSEDAEEYVKKFAEDITEFCECVKSECPFYYTSRAYKHKRVDHCRRAEREE